MLAGSGSRSYVEGGLDQEGEAVLDRISRDSGLSVHFRSVVPQRPMPTLAESVSTCKPWLLLGQGWVKAASNYMGKGREIRPPQRDCSKPGLLQSRLASTIRPLRGDGIYGPGVKLTLSKVAVPRAVALCEQTKSPAVALV